MPPVDHILPRSTTILYFFLLFQTINHLEPTFPGFSSNFKRSIPMSSLPQLEVGQPGGECPTCTKQLLVRQTGDDSNINYKRHYVACDEKSHKSFKWLEPIVHVPHEWPTCSCGTATIWNAKMKKPAYVCWKEAAGCGFKLPSPTAPKWLEHEDCALCGLHGDSTPLSQPASTSITQTPFTPPYTPPPQVRRSLLPQPIPVTMVESDGAIEVFSVVGVSGSSDGSVLTISYPPRGVLPAGIKVIQNDLDLHDSDVDVPKPLVRSIQFPSAVNPKPSKVAKTANFTHWKFMKSTKTETF